MATYSGQIRRGLPRVPGGDPWPAAGESVGGPMAVAGVTERKVQAPAVPAHTVPDSVPAAVERAAVEPAVGATVDQAAPSGGQRQVRRGLPRVPGGEPWPPAGVLAVGASVTAPSRPPSVEAATSAAEAVGDPTAGVKAADEAAATPGGDASSQSVSAASDPAVSTRAGGVPLRRGLPRVPGGEPWPPAGLAPIAVAPIGSAPTSPDAAPAIAAQPAETVAAVPTVAAAVAEGHEGGAIHPRHAKLVDETPASVPAQAEASVARPAPTPVAAPAPAPATPVLAPAAPAPAAVTKKPREPRMLGARTLAQWVKLGVLGGLGVIVAAGIIVLAARGVTTLPGVPEFLERYPGEYHLPETVDPGFPAWARWTHFLNIFMMALIIRSGWQVRTQQKPSAFWTPKRGGRKISLSLWLHTSLDVLWLVNGVVFVVLLFVSGHWARIVPTSWEVFPNAASALLQYLTLEWPVENGWVNYNSLQQLMYFLVVFVAAPLAAITGVRMSEWWPENAERLNRIYPAPVARAIHFPTMLFFVLFIIVHVFLVFATGALRNLNHMFAGSDAVNWVGFWWFAGGLLVTVAAVVAARPLVLAPIANLFGRVSGR